MTTANLSSRGKVWRLLKLASSFFYSVHVTITRSPVKGFINFYEKLWISFKVIFYCSHFRTTFTSSSFHLNFAFLWQVGQFNCAEDPSCLVLLICRVVIGRGLGPHLAYSKPVMPILVFSVTFHSYLHTSNPNVCGVQKTLFRIAVMKGESTALHLEEFLLRCPSNKDCSTHKMQADAKIWEVICPSFCYSKQK